MKSPIKSRELYDFLSLSKTRLTTDTRKLQPGDVYLAIRGDVFDGNAFAAQALESGASYAIIDNPDYKTDDRCILVPDARKTLEELAAIHRARFPIPVLAIGGSNGKTTTKELIGAVLSKKYRVHMTAGNRNNDIGVPLTLLSMRPDTEFAVIEIGANHPGEHAKLLPILSPTHVLVTNNGADHLEGFGSLAGVRAANKEIYDWALKHHARAFVNKSIEDLVEDSAALKRTLYPEAVYQSIPGTYAALEYGGTMINSSLFGAYNEPNMLAAIAVGTAFGVSMEDIKNAIETYRPTLKRSEVISRDGYTIILDCYNANPTSMELALRDFFAATTPGERIVLIGDMLEMGDAEAELHRQMLDFVQSNVSGGDIVLCVGPRFGAFASQYPFSFFETSIDVREQFNALSLDGKTVFVKASRGIRLEEVIQEAIQ